MVITEEFKAIIDEDIEKCKEIAESAEVPLKIREYIK